jgi:uncharacterized protein
MNHDPDTFVNDRVDPAGLPDYRDVSLQPVSGAFLPYATLSAMRVWLVFALAVLAAPHLPLPVKPSAVLIVPLLAIAVWSGVLAWLDARRRGWALREHDLIYRSGVIWRRTVIVPFARIQHVETTSGPLERVFGLMRLNCYTAGGAGGDLTVKGLDMASARRVRQYLLEQIRDDEHLTDRASVPGHDAGGATVDQVSEDDRPV